MVRASGFRSVAGRAAYCSLYDEAVAHAPMPVEQRDIEGRFGVTHVLAAGHNSQAPVIVLHAKSFSSTMWLPLLPALAASRRVFLLDAPGDLNKSVATGVLSSPARVTAWIDETRDALSIGTSAVVGASIGAWMATYYAMAHPTRIERLALVGPAGLVSRQHTRWLLSAILTNAVRPNPARVASFVDSMAMPTTLPRLRGDPWRPIVRQFVEGMSKYRSRLGEPIPRLAALERLASSEFPVLVLIGREESLHDGTLMAQRFTEQVPRAHVELLDDANHLIFIDQTTAVGDRLRAFLKPAAEVQPNEAPPG